MRIDPNVVIFPVASSTTQEKAPRAAGDKGAAVVSLSAGATAAGAERTEGTLDARLERIRGAIDRGEYPIDLDMLSSRIVDDDILRGG
jgi:anti-sigma28 factor (negative regulator of flagellin synthesis)